MIKVLIVDDHSLVRAGLIGLLESVDDFEIVGEAGDGESAVELARSLRPDVVLMDISMPAMDGIAATRLIVGEDNNVKVLAVTSMAEHARVTDMVSAGAVGYLLKDSEPGQLISAVRAAASGQVPLDPRIAAALLPRSESQVAVLSGRELEVLKLTAEGLANKQIARRLGISERTVKAHMGNIFRRINVSDRTSAAMWARDNLRHQSDFV